MAWITYTSTYPKYKISMWEECHGVAVPVAEKIVDRSKDQRSPASINAAFRERVYRTVPWIDSADGTKFLPNPETHRQLCSKRSCPSVSWPCSKVNAQVRKLGTARTRHRCDQALVSRFRKGKSAFKLPIRVRPYGWSRECAEEVTDLRDEEGTGTVDEYTDDEDTVDEDGCEEPPRQWTDKDFEVLTNYNPKQCSPQLQTSVGKHPKPSADHEDKYAGPLGPEKGDLDPSSHIAGDAEISNHVESFRVVFGGIWG